MSELFVNWKWDIFHIGAVLFCIVILWRVITLVIESYKINKDKTSGKR
jgi:Zn-dependent membrane protease YugP